MKKKLVLNSYIYGMICILIFLLPKKIEAGVPGDPDPNADCEKGWYRQVDCGTFYDDCNSNTPIVCEGFQFQRTYLQSTSSNNLPKQSLSKRPKRSKIISGINNPSKDRTSISIDFFDAENLMTPGNLLVVHTDKTNFITMDIGTASDIAQSWTLPFNVNAIPIRDLHLFIDPATITPAEAQEPGATHAYKQTKRGVFENDITISEVYNHYKLTVENDLEELGQTRVINGLLQGDFGEDAQLFADLPLEYDDMYTYYEDKYPAVGDYPYSEVTSDVEVDAFGTINTPYGTFDCLVMFETRDVLIYRDDSSPPEELLYYVITWVTKEGFSFRATIPGENAEGVVQLTNLQMQVIEPLCADTRTVNFSNVMPRRYQAATNLTSNGTINAAQKETVFTAGNSITLQAGFSVAADSRFVATIEDCLPPIIEMPIFLYEEPQNESLIDLNFSVNDQAQVEFTTLLEAENYTIPLVLERSIDGENFFRIGTITGDRNTAMTQAYDFIDKKPNKDMNYYRLRQDIGNGNTLYSEVINVLVTANETSDPTVVLYPNPGKDEVWLSQTADFELYDVNGRLLREGRASGSIPVSMLPKGMYFVKINGGEMLKWVKE